MKMIRDIEFLGNHSVQDKNNAFIYLNMIREISNLPSFKFSPELSALAAKTAYFVSNNV